MVMEGSHKAMKYKVGIRTHHRSIFLPLLTNFWNLARFPKTGAKNGYSETMECPASLGYAELLTVKVTSKLLNFLGLKLYIPWDFFLVINLEKKCKPSILQVWQWSKQGLSRAVFGQTCKQSIKRKSNFSENIFSVYFPKIEIIMFKDKKLWPSSRVFS